MCFKFKQSQINPNVEDKISNVPQLTQMWILKCFSVNKLMRKCTYLV